MADNARFKDVVVADWNQRPFQVIRTENDVNSRCHLVLDRMPKTHQFVGLVQSDSWWAGQAKRDSVNQIAARGVQLYSSSERAGTGHPHGGYQFFFGQNQTANNK